MQNKKAQEMSVTTIILIVLGLFVLVILILGFTMGWNNIKEWVIPSDNVKSINDQCNIACGTDQMYGYCFEKRELKSKEENLKNVTCYSLNTKKPIYGIVGCAAIECGIYNDLTAAQTECKKLDTATSQPVHDAAYEISYITNKAAVDTKNCSVVAKLSEA
jgi:hypothetical protein